MPRSVICELSIQAPSQANHLTMLPPPHPGIPAHIIPIAVRHAAEEPTIPARTLRRTTTILEEVALAEEGRPARHGDAMATR